MIEWNNLPENLSEQVDGLPGAYSASTKTSIYSSHSSTSYRLFRQGNIEAANIVSVNPIPNAAISAIPGISLHSHTPSVPPSRRSTMSLASSPILEHTSSTTHSASPSALPIGLTSSFSSSTPSEASVPDETDSSSEDVHLRGGDGAPGTPATSDASTEADDVFTHGEDNNDQAASAQERDAILIGLGQPNGNRPNRLFSDPDENDGSDLLGDILNEIHSNDRTKFQSRQDARPWAPGTEEFRLPNYDETLHGPDPGPAYNKYHSSTNGHSWKYTKFQRQRKRKQTLATLEPKRRCLGRFGEVPFPRTPQSRDTIPSVPQCSEDWIEVRGRGSGRGRNGGVTYIENSLQRPPVYRLLNGILFSIEECILTFHPSFLVSQLSEASVLTLATEIHGPKGFVRNRDYTVHFFLGFGSPIPLDVCTFATKNNELLRNYQKHQGKDSLDVKYSLPIALDLFSVKIHADELNTWLEERIDSESDLRDFAALMQRRHRGDNLGDHSVQILDPILSWFFEHSRPANQIFRTALKLLMTTTILNVVPKVTSLPDSLLEYLSSQDSSYSPPSSLDAAPRLLNRQIKTSIFHLQQEYLFTLFCHLDSPARLAIDLEAAVALLVAFVLELVGYAGRLFARYSQTINPSAPVKQEDVIRYESCFQKQVFQKVKERISDIESGGQLGEKLRVLNLARKAKERETKGFQFVDEILESLA